MFKRKLNGKMPMVLLTMFVALCASAFAGLREGTWEVNPSEFRYDMSLYFRMENTDFEDLSSFEIGAFVDDECRGIAEKLELTQGESCLYMRIRSNKADGEKLTFLMKDKETGKITHVRPEDASEIIFKADSRIGLPSDPLAMEPCFTAVFKLDGEVYKTYEVGFNDPIEAPEVPEKEGYTFNGWGDVPSAMPGYDIEFHSSYSVNNYRITFKIGDEEIFSAEIPFGSAIIAPEAPVEEGKTFDGWGDVPETMPAYDLEFVGSYTVHKYNVVYKIDGEVVFSAQASVGEKVPAFNDVPGKTGYSFSGWTEIPESMPARDVEINGSYTVNHYTVTFSIGDEVFVSQELAYDEEIIVPEAPAKDGYTFSGWGNVPAAMPAGDLYFNGDYSVNSYSVVFRIDQEVFQTLTVEYGAVIEVPVAPDMEGHTFSGWGEVPATMPAYDLVFVGTYAENYYTITFRIGDEIIKMADLAYEAEIILPDVPEKEGHSFSGWGDVPATMPASNIEINGYYTVNNYRITFKIDDFVISTSELAYGSDIVAPEAPEKEGCSFSGWGIVPATMPASDLVISGMFSPNTYTLTFFIDGEIFYTTQVLFGLEISAPEPPAKEGYSLVGWTDVPATMPAYDLNMDASYVLNSYKLTFKIGDEEIFSGELPYGTEILAPEPPAKEGYSFSGWGMVPATMPASDLEIVGSYDVNIYNLTFTIDGETFYATTIAYGSEIVAPVVPEVEGQSFSGWGEVPDVMPANDLYINGTYAPNCYLLTFRVGEEVIFSGEVPYGADITVPTAPEREGYSFNGWGDVPAKMPASNLDINGSFSVNSYLLKFMIGDEVVFEAPMEYGAEITVPDAPAKEGNTFLGWGVVPSVMPASDLIITGAYEVNSYSLVFKIGDEVFYSAQLAYGAEISVPEVPEREGYAFSGWGEYPKTMPARDLEFSGRYDVKTYTLTFKVEGEVIASSQVEFGAVVIEPIIEDKVGYTFSGWGIVPATMPAYDIEFTGSYIANSYTLTLRAEGEVVYTASLAYGSEIDVPYVPEKTGYTFSGWEGLPATMPARDLDLDGVYVVNSYKLTLYIDGEMYMVKTLDYGAEIILPEPEVKEGHIFDGWPADVPSTMPDHDLDVYGTTSGSSAVGSLPVDDDSIINVFTLDGILILKNVVAADAFERLTPGIYIINGRKVVVR